MWHIVERFWTHIFWDPGFILALSFGLRTLQKKTQWKWLPKKPIQIICVSGALVLPIAIAREPYDIHASGWWGKSYFDIASHFIAVVLGCWALYRMIMWGVEVYGRNKQ